MGTVFRARQKKLERIVALKVFLSRKLTLHADRGSSMRSKPVTLLLADLGITKTHSRPHVSNYNPFRESQFKTLKYRPDFPDSLRWAPDARVFCRPFFHWYNDEHRHSGNRVPHAGFRPPRPRRADHCGEGGHAPRCPPRSPRAIRSQGPAASSATHRRLDQPAIGRKPRLLPYPNLLQRLSHCR